MRTATLIPLLVASLALAGCGLGRANLRPAGGALAACDSGPHCVSSSNHQPRHAIDPITFEGPLPAARERLLAVLRQMPRVEIIEVTADYVHAQATTRWMRYVDDLEFRLRGQTIELRSSSRIGYYDFEVNRQRLEAIRRRFTDHGAPP
jgi:uncharacterized protein (DUF1499 family)